MNDCIFYVFPQGEPGLPGEAGMEGVPGPKVKKNRELLYEITTKLRI